jgi:hypothetical protein
MKTKAKEQKPKWYSVENGAVDLSKKTRFRIGLSITLFIVKYRSRNN